MAIDQLADLDHVKLVNAGLLLQAVFIFCFTITSFVVAGTANAGFNVVLTSFLYILYVAGSYHVLNKSKMPLSVGFVLGVSVMVTFLSLMTAIFWGQLSGCTKGVTAARYSCTNTSAYGAACAFATLLFIIQVFFTAALVLWRDDFLSDEGGLASYDDIHGHGSSSLPEGGVPPYSHQQAAAGSYNNAGGSTADL